MGEIYYPSVDRIIEYNFMALTLIKVKKSDKPQTLSYDKLNKLIEECMTSEGDLYDKATILLKGIIKAHAFASGNRRTAFITLKDFLTENRLQIKITNNPEHAKVMTGIRDGFYSDNEIKEWIKNGQIRELEDKKNVE